MVLEEGRDKSTVLWRTLVRDPQDDQRDVVARLRLGEVEYGAGHLLGDLAGAQSGTRAKQRFDVRRLEGVRGRIGIGEAIRIQEQAVRRMDLDGGVGQVWISLGAQHEAVRSDLLDGAVASQEKRERVPAGRARQPEAASVPV
ncbi:MAG TPA: hypothetical protein VK510_01795, partial [Solirubrobacteraceae bacterium]|nr:hypothetical protein [Solirubrobacteraceae bacterium]